MIARRFVIGVTALVLALTAPSLAHAQGTVSGRVLQGATLQPLAGVQVVVVGGTIGAITNSDGRYTLASVPAGTVNVEARVLGFTTQTKSVAVTADGTVTLDFMMEQQALALDELVVTGTAGGAQRRTIGNVVGRVDVADAVEKTPPASIQTMMAGRVAGMSVQVGGGNVGTGGNIIIRGMGTMALGSGPLLYIDGIRANGGMQGQNNGAGSSRLNDINPEDIERIEVIKGPAAATLYGTEASNGVIQIITKKGAAGAVSIEAAVRQGANWFQNPGGRLPINYGLSPDRTTVISQNLFEDEKAANRDIFRSGDIRSYSLNLRGGPDRLTYFLSGNRDEEEGFMRNNQLERTTLRSNLRLSVSDRVDLSTDIGVIRSETTFAPDGTAGTTGIFSMLIWGTPSTRDTPSRGFMVGPPEYQDMIDIREQLNRATASVTANHNPTDWLSQRLVLGVDWTDGQRSTFYPRLPEGTPAFYGANSTGSKQLSHDRDLNQTADYNITATLDLNPSLSSSTSFGAQYFTRQSRTGSATGSQLPTPAVSTVSAGAVRTGTESYVENKTFGVYAQQMFGWENRAFLTMALRADANSAFGESFKAAYYPKLSATWVLSDESFWNVPLVESFRLRTAWGRSGLQPDAFAATRTYAPTTGPNDVPAVMPGNVGNPDLKPEVGEEIELGFDASLFSNRLSLEVTHYRKTTTDLILQELVAPSAGFPGSRYVNAGELSNRGWELQFTALPVSNGLFDVSLVGALSRNTNTLEDLGGRPPIAADTRGRFQHREGYPLGGYWTKYIATAEWGPSNTLINVTCKGAAEDDYAPMPCASAPFHFVGAPGPVWNGSLSPSISIGNLEISSMFVWFGESRRFNTTEWYRDVTQRNSERAQYFLLGTLDPIEAAEISVPDIEHQWMERDDFIRMRDISATYTLPSNLAGRMGVSRAMITVSGRNLWTPWVHPSFRESGLDPETKRQRTVPWGWQQTQAPLPHSIVTTVRVTF